MFKAIKLMRVDKGILTSPYPDKPDSYGPSFKGQPIADITKCNQCGECVKICPTSAIKLEDKGLNFDLGLCIYCGNCAKACSPNAITITPNFELSTKDKSHLQVKFDSSPNDVIEAGNQLKMKIDKVIGRSLGIRQVDAGSCNACEWEVNALAYPFSDMDRFGIHIVASPRHADIILVSGPMTRNMLLGLQHSVMATPDPKWIVAMGSCAISGGIFKDSYAVDNGCDEIVPIDLYIPGCPPSPLAMIQGFMVLLDKMEEKIIRKNP